MCASHHAHSNVAQNLIEARAHLEICAADGKTALLWACVIAQSSETMQKEGPAGATEFTNRKKRIISTLLDAKANIEVADTSGTRCLAWLTLAFDVELMEMLLIRGANVDSTDAQDLTCLMLAASKSHAGMARLLLAHKASVRAQDSQGWTALMWACDCVAGSGDIVSLLLAENAQLEHCSDEHHTRPLMVAAGRGRASILTLLLDARADTQAVDYKNRTALDLAKLRMAEGEHSAQWRAALHVLEVASGDTPSSLDESVPGQALPVASKAPALVLPGYEFVSSYGDPSAVKSTMVFRNLEPSDCPRVLAHWFHVHLDDRYELFSNETAMLRRVALPGVTKLIKSFPEFCCYLTEFSSRGSLDALLADPGTNCELSTTFRCAVVREVKPTNTMRVCLSPHLAVHLLALHAGGQDYGSASGAQDLAR